MEKLLRKFQADSWEFPLCACQFLMSPNPLGWRSVLCCHLHRPQGSAPLKNSGQSRDQASSFARHACHHFQRTLRNSCTRKSAGKSHRSSQHPHHCHLPQPTSDATKDWYYFVGIFPECGFGCSQPGSSKGMSPLGPEAEIFSDPLRMHSESTSQLDSI